jgi:HAD superfamily hydrolase (TIGR01509 family)
MTFPAAVLWDMDGTLVDTEPYWVSAQHEIVESFGGTWTDDLALELVGKDLMVSAQLMRENSPITWDDERIVHELLARVVAAVRAHVPWRPGARELLAALGVAGVPCALVTMSWTSMADAVLAALPRASFAEVITGDRVAHGKPHPEPYLVACRELAVEPSQCVALEDSPTGVLSAVAAGVPTVAVPSVLPVPEMAGAVQVDTLQGVGPSELATLGKQARDTAPPATGPTAIGQSSAGTT